MKNKKCIFLFIFFSSISVFSQSKTVDIKKVDSLVSLKKQMINNYDIKSFYTIQLFYGKKNGAENVKKEYDFKMFKYKAIIEYETPNYKVWVGRFRTRLEADKAFSLIKKDYPSALILKPGR